LLFQPNLKSLYQEYDLCNFCYKPSTACDPASVIGYYQEV
jgi:hypothetical protein